MWNLLVSFLGRFPVISYWVALTFSFCCYSTEMLKTHLHQNALSIIYAKWQITTLSKTEWGDAWAVSKWVLCCRPIGQLWSGSPDCPLVQFSERFGAPRADSYWEKPKWGLHPTSHEVQEASLPPYGSQYMPNTSSFHKASNHKS